MFGFNRAPHGDPEKPELSQEQLDNQEAIKAAMQPEATFERTKKLISNTWWSRALGLSLSATAVAVGGGCSSQQWDAFGNDIKHLPENFLAQAKEASREGQRNTYPRIIQEHNANRQIGIEADLGGVHKFESGYDENYNELDYTSRLRKRKH